MGKQLFIEMQSSAQTVTAIALSGRSKSEISRSAAVKRQSSIRKSSNSHYQIGLIQMMSTNKCDRFGNLLILFAPIINNYEGID